MKTLSLRDLSLGETIAHLLQRKGGYEEREESPTDKSLKKAINKA